MLDLCARSGLAYHWLSVLEPYVRPAEPPAPVLLACAPDALVLADAPAPALLASAPDAPLAQMQHTAGPMRA